MSDDQIFDADAPEPDRDEGQESLADALKLSFTLLRWVMILLLGYFGFSGLYSVEEGTVVIQTRFGQILGEVGLQARPPGGPYFALPAPLDRRIIVSTRDASIVLDRAFWFAMDEKDRVAKRTLDELKIPPGGLVPGKDGSLLTGDQNIVHGQWQVNFHVKREDAVRFVNTFGEMDDAAKKAIRFAAEQGICRTVAGTTADAFLSAAFDRQAAKRSIQTALDAMAMPSKDGTPRRAGITVTEVLLNQPTPPLAVRASFTEVAQAESEKAQKIERARRVRARTLNEVAGAGYQAVLVALDRYEEARGDSGLRQERENEITVLLSGTKVGGMVSQRVREAQTYRTQVVETVRTEADYFKRLLPQFKDNPRIVWEFLWQETVWEIYGGDVEKFYVPEGAKSIYLELSRDPVIALRGEHDKFRKELDKRRKAEK